MTELNKIADSDVRPSVELAGIHGTFTPSSGILNRRIVRRRVTILIVWLVSLLLVVLLAAAQGSHYPTWILVVEGTLVSGDEGSLSVYDGTYLQVNEVNLGTLLDRTATEQWIVQGTLDSGTFPDDMETHNGVGVIYQEADDDNGALTGDSILLTPTGVGTHTGWLGTSPAAQPHWQMVDDDPPHDSNVTFVFTNNDGAADTYAMEDISVVPAGTKLAGTVTTFAWALRDGADPNTKLGNVVITHSTEYISPYASMVAWPAYKNLTHEWVTNPNTGLDWTAAEIAAMEVGVKNNNAGMEIYRMTSVGAVIPLQDLNYVLDVRHNITAVPAGGTYYNLSMRAHTDFVETFTVFVYDHVALEWDTMFMFDGDTYESETYQLTPADHINDGEVWVRTTDFIGDAGMSDQFDIDHLRVHVVYLNYTGIVDLSYSQVNVPPNTQGILTLVGYRDGDTEAITLQVGRGDGWVQLGADIFTSSRSTETYPIDVADIYSGMLTLRIADSDPTDDTQTAIYLDYAEVILTTQDPPSSPVFPDFEAEYDWWSGDLTLTDDSYSYAGHVETWNWRVDGDYAGDEPDLRVGIYPWWDMGRRKVEVRLEVMDEMGYSATEFKYVWVDNGLRALVVAMVFLLVAAVFLLVVMQSRIGRRFREFKRRRKWRQFERKEKEDRTKRRIPRVR